MRIQSWMIRRYAGTGGDENLDRAGLGFKEESTGVMIFDDNEQFVRGMIRQKKGIHYFSYGDEDGKEIIVR